MTECIFCKIVNNELPADKVYEDDEFLAFHDIHPKASTHVLVIPKQHIESLAHLEESHAELVGTLMLHLKKIALSLGLDNGFRTVINTGKAGGQEVDHLHVHILGGKLKGF